MKEWRPKDYVIGAIFVIVLMAWMIGTTVNADRQRRIDSITTPTSMEFMDPHP